MATTHSTHSEAEKVHNNMPTLSTRHDAASTVELDTTASLPVLTVAEPTFSTGASQQCDTCKRKKSLTKFLDENGGMRKTCPEHSTCSETKEDLDYDGSDGDDWESVDDDWESVDDDREADSGDCEVVDGDCKADDDNCSADDGEYEPVGGDSEVADGDCKADDDNCEAGNGDRTTDDALDVAEISQRVPLYFRELADLIETHSSCGHPEFAYEVSRRLRPLRQLGAQIARYHISGERVMAGGRPFPAAVRSYKHEDSDRFDLVIRRQSF